MNRRLTYILLLIFSLLVFSSSRISYISQPDAISGPTRKPVNSWVYVDLIITDYNTGKPEGHYLYNLCKPPSIAAKDITVTVSTQTEKEFSKTYIIYGSNSDTLFAGSGAWTGTGSRTKPTSIDTIFTLNKETLAKPAYFQFLNTDIDTLDPKYLKRANLAWTQVSKMQILSVYSGVNFKTAFFLYNPCLGKNNLYYTKWIILLERDAGCW
jgi:hypothetical protein